MARFSDVVTLRAVRHVQNAEGVVETVAEDAEVFFNRFSVGLQSRLAGASAGLKGMASGQVRSIDYAGQPTAVLDGLEYTVEDASDDGELTTLTLARRLPDGR